jgi:hypothetical protein
VSINTVIPAGQFFFSPSFQPAAGRSDREKNIHAKLTAAVKELS